MIKKKFFSLKKQIKLEKSAKSGSHNFEIENLTNFIKNPVKTLIENTHVKSDSHHGICHEGNHLKNVKKDKLNEIIQKQKEQHERRIKALEKLTRLEKLQAEKLKKILLLNKSNAISPNVYETLFGDESVAVNETTVDIEEAFEKDFFNEERNYLKNYAALNDISEPNESFFDESIQPVKNEQKNCHKKVSFDSDEDDETPPPVEVVDLKNTSVYEIPRGIMVIKESMKRNESEKNENEIRKTSSVPSFVVATNQTTMHNRNSETNLHSKPVTWLYSLANNQPVAETARSCLVKNEHSNKENLVEYQPAKMSLQEAFEMNRYDLISRSRQRQKEIQYRNELRRKEAEYEIERMALYQKNNNNNNNNLNVCTANKYKTKFTPNVNNSNNNGKPNKSEPLRINYFEVNVENFMHKRQMSSQEIKTQTKKNYSKLPEVKQKQLQIRAEELKRRNRIKSTIYKKVTEKKMLSLIKLF